MQAKTPGQRSPAEDGRMTAAKRPGLIPGQAGTLGGARSARQSFCTMCQSAGCAAMGADNDRFADMIARADVGLVMAKRAGRNRVIVADEGDFR